jgi:hypothetical protein
VIDLNVEPYSFEKVNFIKWGGEEGLVASEDTNNTDLYMTF